MDFAYYILAPFTWLLMFFYQVFDSYGVALILFALIVKMLLFPLSVKGKRSMIQMNMLSGKMQKLQKQYGKNPERYNAEVQKLYEKENVSPMGGCLWSMLPLFILLPLYAIIRQPLKYMMGMTVEQMVEVGNSVLNWAQVSIDMGWVRAGTDVAQNLLTEATAKAGYNQLHLASLITPENLEAVKAAAGATMQDIFCLNFHFLGVDLAQTPTLKFWANGLAGLGLFLVPMISAATSVVFSMISMKTNKMNQGEKNDQMDRTSRMMMFVSPVMSLWIGFSMPAALSVYWIANNVLGLAQEVISGRMLKDDYAKAAEAQRQRELEEKEEEKRIRREKAEERARLAEEARKNKGKKKEKDPDQEKMTPEQREAARVGIRQYARGRAYDPDRFGGVTPYHVIEEDLLMEQVEREMQSSKKGKKAQQAEPVVETPAETPVEAPEASVEVPAAEPAEAPVEDLTAAVDAQVADIQAEIDAALESGEDQTKED